MTDWGVTTTPDEFVGNTLYFRNRSAQRVQHQEVLAVMPDPDGLSLLDVGCGWGDFSVFLPETTRYLGIDIRPDMIEMAQGCYRNREFRVSSRITKADIIVAIGAIGDEIVHPRLLIQRMYRQASKAVIFTVQSAWVHHYYSEDRLRSWCPQEPDVFDRRDDFFRVAMYK